MIGSYGKIYVLGHRALENLFVGPVVVQEKVDGSQLSFGWLEGRLQMRSKGAVIDLDGPPKMFKAGVRIVQGMSDTLAHSFDNCVFRGEYLATPKHNHLKYDRVPTGHIVLFDIDNWAPTELTQAAKFLGLDSVPSLFEGEIKDNAVEQIHEWLKTPSFLGGPTVEGVVIKNYNQLDPFGGGNPGPLMGKFVSEVFKETAGAEWKLLNPSGKDVVDTLIERLRTEARWRKAVIHLREQERLTEDVKDIGALIVEVQRDVLEEEGDRIRDALFSVNKRRIANGVVRGLPEWYKDYLLAKQFEVAQ